MLSSNSVATFPGPSNEFRLIRNSGKRLKTGRRNSRRSDVPSVTSRTVAGSTASTQISFCMLSILLKCLQRIDVLRHLKCPCQCRGIGCGRLQELAENRQAKHRCIPADITRTSDCGATRCIVQLCQQVDLMVSADTRSIQSELVDAVDTAGVRRIVR